MSKTTYLLLAVIFLGGCYAIGLPEDVAYILLAIGTGAYLLEKFIDFTRNSDEDSHL